MCYPCKWSFFILQMAPIPSGIKSVFIIVYNLKIPLNTFPMVFLLSTNPSFLWQYCQEGLQARQTRMFQVSKYPGCPTADMQTKKMIRNFWYKFETQDLLIQACLLTKIRQSVPGVAEMIREFTAINIHLFITFVPPASKGFISLENIPDLNTPV